MKTPLLLFAASVCFGGQGLVVGANEVAYNNNIPALAPGTPYRIEMSLQNVTCNWHPVNVSIANTGAFVYCPSSGNNMAVGIIPNAETGTLGFCSIPAPSSSGFVSGFVTFRFQHRPAPGGGGSDTCQGWDVNGTLLVSSTSTYSAETNTYSTGVSIGDEWGVAGNVVNYLRVYTSAVGIGSRPPITSDWTDSSRVFEWKFDGSLNDSGPGQYTASVMTNWNPGGVVTYVATLGQSLVVPLVTNTNLSPSWPAPIPGYEPSWRAGQPGELSCANSYTQSDNSSISCFWQVLLQPGQMAPFWSDQTSQTPTLTGLVFGDYSIQLTVTDQAGDTATALTHIGAVATDSNGVVVNANPAADAILGPMIAFGRNPWGLGDYWHLAGSIQREAQYIAAGMSPTWPYAAWEERQAGTVSYNYIGLGMAPTYLDKVHGTTLASGCSETASSCTVTNAAGLDLSTLPTRIYISSAGSNRSTPQFEEIRVCSVSGNVLTFCYDGRGFADPNNSTRLAAGSWNAGDVVGQDKLTGTRTRFLTTLCPAGAPGPMGQVTYSTGALAVAAGSTAVTLAGGTWTPAAVAPGYEVVVSATHSGTPFTFISPISSLVDGTHLILTRPFPSDAETASGLKYSILNQNVFVDLGYQTTQGSTAVTFLKYWPTSYGCESDTSAFIYPAWDPGVSGGQVTTAQPYSYQVGNWWYNQSSTGGLDFYSEDLANLAGWLRSGLKQFHDSSMMIGDIWSRHPQKSNGGNGSLLFYGGPVIGGFANALLSDTGHGTQWQDLRSYAITAISGYPGVASAANDCNNDDSREKGYQGAWLALAAEFDPDTSSTDAPDGISWRQYWQNALVQYAANEAACENQFGNTDNSWRSTFGAWPESQSAANAVTLTDGSTAGTGSGLANKFCYGVAQASNVTVTNGSGIVTGSGFPTTGWNRVAITGPGLVGRNGNPVPTLWVYATPISSSQFAISFGGTWPGTSSSAAGVMFDNGSALGGYVDGVTSFLSSEADPMSQYEWSCIYNSPSSITLNRPWTGSTGVNYAYTSNVTGFNILPYMLGIRQYAFWQGQNASSGSVANAFRKLRIDAGIYEHSVYDPIAGANYYAIQPACDPITPASMGNSICYSGYPPTGLPGANYSFTAERVNTIENSMSLTDYHVSQSGSSAAIAWGDMMYGNCMGNPSFTSAGAYVATDGNTCDSGNGNLNATTNYGIGAGKWYGFFFGIGASWRWPAQRFGGVQAAQLRDVFVGFDLGAVASAASVEIVVTAPSGAQGKYDCSSSPCKVTVDDRQGSHLYRMSYLSNSCKVLSQSEPALLD
jgi:hypothetical protein